LSKKIRGAELAAEVLIIALLIDGLGSDDHGFIFPRLKLLGAIRTGCLEPEGGVVFPTPTNSQP
jgi:hypothetical protein